MSPSLPAVVRAVMYLHGTALVQGAEGFACNVATLGGGRWLGQDTGCKGHFSQLQFNFASMVERPMNFQPYHLPCYGQCFQLMEQVG